MNESAIEISSESETERDTVEGVTSSENNNDSDASCLSGFGALSDDSLIASFITSTEVQTLICKTKKRKLSDAVWETFSSNSDDLSVLPETSLDSSSSTDISSLKCTSESTPRRKRPRKRRNNSTASEDELKTKIKKIAEEQFPAKLKMEQQVEDLENKMKQTDERMDDLALQVGNIEQEMFSEKVEEIAVNNLLRSVTEVKTNYQHLREELMEVQDLQKQLSTSLHVQLKVMQSKFNTIKEKIYVAPNIPRSRPKSPN